jgi:hypothetical protein
MESILHINERGNYSLQVTSPTGTRFALIDRMAGEIAVEGRTGVEDGRIDALLDEGDYKVVMYGEENKRGRTNLQVFRYRDVGASKNLWNLPLIRDGEMVVTTLADLQQRSFWLYIDEEPVHMEVMGRNLTAVRFWKEGQWLIGVSPKHTIYETETGKPMTHIEIAQALPQGYYLLTCVGGRALGWTEESDESPLYIRSGVPYLGDNGGRKVTVSPFGRDAFWVDGEADYFQLVRAERESVRLGVARFVMGRSRFELGKRAELDEKAGESWCTVRGTLGGERQWVVVEAAPGSTMELIYFKEQRSHQFPEGPRTRSYWVSSVGSAEARNTIDITPLLFDPLVTEVRYENPLHVGPSNPLIRKVNLLGQNTAFLRITRGGSYRILEDEDSGARGRYRFHLFEDAISNTGVTPEFQTSDQIFELAEELYILDFIPAQPGILHFVLYNAEEGSVEEARRLLEENGTGEAEARDFTWPKVDVERGRLMPLYLLFNLRHDVATGLIVRELPLDLTEPLSLALGPGEGISLPVKLAADSNLSIEGGDYGVTLSGKPIDSGARLGQGEYLLRLDNLGKERSYYTLRFVNEPILPELDLKTLEELFPLIIEEEPLFSDFERNESKRYLLRVEEPSFYRLETVGRLSMGINIRTALALSLFSVRNNGVGRNALVQTFLKAGDYMVEAYTLGASRGRAGLRLARTPLIDAGTLYSELVDRRTVDADQALVYRVDASEGGAHSLQTLGLGRSFRFRLEEPGGWPLVSPLGRGAIRLELDPGTYTYYSLPEPVATRRLTLLERQEAESGIKGDGVLVFNRAIETIWRESPDRRADLYVIDVPAPVRSSFRLTEGMVAVATGPGLVEKKELSGGVVHDLELSVGSYSFQIRSQEEDDRKNYSLILGTEDLIPGLSHRITNIPASLPVSLGEEAIVDLWSFGTSDIKAVLLDDTGAVVLAENDDREDDWNFALSRRLRAGRYILKVEQAGAWSGSATVAMATREERSLREEALPFTSSEVLAREVVTVPFKTGPEVALVRFQGFPSQKISLALFRAGRLIAEGQDSLIIPLQAGSLYHISFWHQGDVRRPVGINALVIDREHLEENALRVEESRLYYPPSFAAVVRNDRGLSAVFSSSDMQLLFSPGVERPCLPVGRVPENTAGGVGWLVGLKGTDIGAVRVSPLSLVVERPRAVLLGDLPHSFLISNEKDEALLLEARSQGLTVGVALAPADLYRQETYRWEGMDSDVSRTLVGLPGAGDYQGKLWDTRERPGRDSPGQESPGQESPGRVSPGRVSLTLTSFSIQEQVRLQEGASLEVTVAPRRATQVSFWLEISWPSPGMTGSPALLRRRRGATVSPV